MVSSCGRAIVPFSFSFKAAKAVVILLISFQTASASNTTFTSQEYEISDCSDIAYDTFESGWGIWNDGGSDARKSRGYYGQGHGKYQIRLRDNSGKRSSMYTDAINLEGKASATIAFTFSTFNLKKGEKFILEYSLNNGNSYKKVKTWVKGTDFDNRKSYKPSIEIKSLFSSKTRFRLRADASSNRDLIYIDNVTISACNSDVVDPPIDEICDTELKIENDSSCELRLFKNGRYLEKIDANRDWKGIVNIHDKFSVTNDYNDTKERYQVTEECDQIWEINADCTPPACKPRLRINNLSECDFAVYINKRYVYRIRDYKSRSFTTNVGDSVRINGENGFVSRYTITDLCHQVLDINQSCITPPVCDKVLKIENDSRCILNIYNRGRYITTLDPSQDYRTELRDRDRYEARTEYNKTVAEYSANDKCDQKWELESSLCDPIDPPTSNTCVLSHENFESGFGIWNDGGSDCYRLYEPSNGITQNYCIRLRDNSGKRSSLYTDKLNLQDDNSVTISFVYITDNLRDGEDFLLEYSLDDGYDYQVAKAWKHGVDFNNSVLRFDTVAIETNFTSKTRFRFRADASSNSDKVYIDEIVISRNCDNENVIDQDHSLSEKTETKTKTYSALAPNEKLILSPSPASEYLNISHLDSDEKYSVLSIDGREIYKNQNNNSLDVKNLDSGTYIIKTTNGRISRFVKI